MRSTPFRYPKTRHARAEKPPTFSNYKRFKPYLQREFEHKCVYCRMPDTMKGAETFGVDHYQPKGRFPKLEVEYRNLYYSCNPCNSRKKEFWPSTSQRRRGIFIPNPCDHRMFEHLRFRGERVARHSEAGHWTKELLDLNDPEVVSYRQFMHDMIAQCQGRLAELRKTLRDIDGRSAAAGDDPSAELTAAREQIQGDVDRIDGHLGRLLGDPRT